MKKYLSLLFLFLLPVAQSLAQCSMCRATVANNVSNGDQIGLAAGLNNGILYLFVAPYLLVGLIAFFWYKTAKAGRQSKHSRPVS